MSDRPPGSARHRLTWESTPTPSEAGCQAATASRSRPGLFGFKQVELDYRIGSKPYTARLEDGFVACAPLADYPTGCPEEQFFGPRP